MFFTVLRYPDKRVPIGFSHKDGRFWYVNKKLLGKKFVTDEQWYNLHQALKIFLIGSVRTRSTNFGCVFLFFSIIYNIIYILYLISSIQSTSVALKCVHINLYFIFNFFQAAISRSYEGAHFKQCDIRIPLYHAHFY